MAKKNQKLQTGSAGRAEAELQARLRQQAAVAELGQLALTEKNLSLLMDRAVALVAETLEVKYCKVLELLPEGTAFLLRAGIGWLEGEHLHAVAGRGFPHLEQVVGRRYPADDALHQEIRRTGRALILTDAQADPRFQRWGGTDYVHGWLGVPLIVRDEIIGYLTLDSRQVGAYGPVEATLAQAFANQAAVAIQNARLFQESQRRTQELAVLYDTALALSGVLNTEALLARLYEQVQQLMSPDSFGVFLYHAEDNALEILLAMEAGEAVSGAVGSRLPLDERGLTGWVACTRRPLLVGDMETDPLPVAPKHLTQPPARSWLGVPLMARDCLVGVISVQSFRPQAFGQADCRLLELLAAQVAIALENTRLFAQTQAQARQIQQLIDTVPDGVLLLDSERCILLSNPAAQEHLAVLGAPPRGEALTHLGGYPIERLLEPPPEGLAHEVTVTGPPDRVFEVVTRPTNHEGQIGGWVLVIRDVTQEREVQRRIHQQERLAAVGQLAAGIAHDFNNILTSIIGFAQLARFHPATPPSAATDMERIVQQGQRAAQLLRQILDFSRKSITEKRPIHLVSFLKETVKLLQRTIPESIQIVVDIAPGDYILNGDPVQIQQALTNLAVNARDAMPAGGTLRFGLSRLSLRAGDRPPAPDIPPGDWIVLSVSDTGEGIPSEVLPHVFEPFFTTKEVGQGTGLGLAQVYGIVKQHEGYIEVSSRLGKGTTFTLFLPSAPAALQTQAKPPSVEVPRGQGELILLVEDEPAVREVASNMLTRLGYRVLTATNGREALEMCHQHPGEIALVLTDVTMPEMGGIMLARLLKAKYPHVKVVALTGYPLEAEDKDWLSRGVVAWLQKPLGMEELAQAVRRALGEGA